MQNPAFWAVLVENDTEVATMELTGKKINFLGGSITEGAGVADPANVFPARLARM